MPKTPKKSKSPSPEWARLVRELRQELGFNQAELGAETALFGNGYPGGNVEGKSLPIGPTSNSGTSPETQSVGIFGDEPVCIMKTCCASCPRCEIVCRRARSPTSEQRVQVAWLRRPT